MIKRIFIAIIATILTFTVCQAKVLFPDSETAKNDVELGAVAGNIIGAILGYKAIPDKFKDTIQLKNPLLSTADALSQN